MTSSSTDCPKYLSKFTGLQHNGVVQINGKSFLYPNAPYLLKPREVRADMVCKVGAEKSQKEPQCIQVLELEDKDMVEIVIVNEGNYKERIGAWTLVMCQS